MDSHGAWSLLGDKLGPGRQEGHVPTAPPISHPLDYKEGNHLERQPALQGAAPSKGLASTHPPPNQKLRESACGAGGVSRFVLEDSSSLMASGAEFSGKDPQLLCAITQTPGHWPSTGVGSAARRPLSGSRQGQKRFRSLQRNHQAFLCRESFTT